MKRPLNTITRNDVTEGGDTVRGLKSGHEFIAEASELGWPPGKWPESAATNLGNTMPFRLTRLEKTPDGEVMYAKYFQTLGCIRLTVFND